jgi:hypothetical protein
VNEFDKAMVRALNTVMNKYGTRSERIREKAWRTLSRDPPLFAFFRSVEQAGEEAWSEERLRVGRRFAFRTVLIQPHLRREMTRDGAVWSLLGVWREWGK